MDVEKKEDFEDQEVEKLHDLGKKSKRLICDCVGKRQLVLLIRWEP